MYVCMYGTNSKHANTYLYEISDGALHDGMPGLRNDEPVQNDVLEVVVHLQQLVVLLALEHVEVRQVVGGYVAAVPIEAVLFVGDDQPVAGLDHVIERSNEVAVVVDVGASECVQHGVAPDIRLGRSADGVDRVVCPQQAGVGEGCIHESVLHVVRDDIHTPMLVAGQKLVQVLGHHINAGGGKEGIIVYRM